MTDTVPVPVPATRRRRWGRLIAIVAGVLLVAVIAMIVRILWIGGAFTRLRPHFAGTCRLVDGPVGPEDITINQRTGRAYISATDRRAIAAGRPVPGAIWAYDLTTFDAQPIALTGDRGVEFQPHGISLWIEPDGSETLFIISHPVPASGWPAHVVEIADLRDRPAGPDAGAPAPSASPPRLRHRATLTDPRLVMPNDLVAVGIDSFYVTNTHAHPPGFRQTLETYLQRPGAQVLAYGPGGFRVALDDMVFPNGTTASPDGRTVYVAAMTWQEVLVFDRDPTSGALTRRGAIPIGSSPDNLEVDPDGTLWIGSHAKLLTVPKHAADLAVPAPAQVLRVRAGATAADEIYLSEGEPLSASSVAARYGKRLLIGQIFGRGFLDCEME